MLKKVRNNATSGSVFLTMDSPTPFLLLFPFLSPTPFQLPGNFFSMVPSGLLAAGVLDEALGLEQLEDAVDGGLGDFNLRSYVRCFATGMFADEGVDGTHILVLLNQGHDFFSIRMNILAYTVIFCITDICQLKGFLLPEGLCFLSVLFEIC